MTIGTNDQAAQIAELAPPHQRFVRAVCRAAFSLIGRVEARGLERMPGRGPFLFCANHMSYFDAPLVFAYLPPVRLYVLAARKYRNHLLFGPVMRLANVIWIQQRGADREALAQADDVLRQGHVLAVAPEGTRSKTHTLMEPRPGAAYLATALNVPILPCALEGTDDIRLNLPRLRGTSLRLTLGKPFRLAPVEGNGRTAQLSDRTDVIMAHIAQMLPDRYRGVYADHPYLKQLEENGGPLPGELPA